MEMGLLNIQIINCTKKKLLIKTRMSTFLISMGLVTSSKDVYVINHEITKLILRNYNVIMTPSRNRPFFVIMNELRSFPFWVQNLVSTFMKSNSYGPIVQKSAKEFIWGYEDPLLSVLSQVRGLTNPNLIRHMDTRTGPYRTV